MTVQTFRELLTQQPFQPFRLVMSSGQTYDVRHPEMAMLTRTSLLVGIEETEEHVAAEFQVSALLHVTAECGRVVVVCLCLRSESFRNQLHGVGDDVAVGSGVRDDDRRVTIRVEGECPE